MKHCVTCGTQFAAQTAWHRYCSPACQQRKRREVTGEVRRHRYCRQCGTFFIQPFGSGRREHCTDECARKSARESRSKFYKRNPGKDAAYRVATKERRAAAGLKDGNLVRLRQRCPGTPSACQACGESRVVQIAHKPAHRRNGAWRSTKNTHWPDTVWILCPTCHVLLDHCGYTPEQLKLV